MSVTQTKAAAESLQGTQHDGTAEKYVPAVSTVSITIPLPFQLVPPYVIKVRSIQLRRRADSASADIASQVREPTRMPYDATVEVAFD